MDIYKFINGFFDFEEEDEPKAFEEYEDVISYMWISAKRHNRELELYTALRRIIESPQDPEILLNSYFLPGKHDLRQVLQLALDRRPDSDLE